MLFYTEKKKFMCLTRLLLPTLTNDTTGYGKENEEIGLGFVYIPKYKIKKKKKLKPKQTKKTQFSVSMSIGKRL